MANTRDPALRLRQNLNPILTTALGGGPRHFVANTPLSTVSTTSQWYHSSSPSQTPSSSIQPYNPQRWVESPAAVAERMMAAPPSAPHDEPHGTVRPLSLFVEHTCWPLSNSAGVASSAPPPPYSPPRSRRPSSGMLESPPLPPPPANVSANRVPPTTAQRPSPEPTINSSFPPPPNAQGRGSSRDRRFGITSLGRRRDVMEPGDTPSPSNLRSHRLTMQVGPRGLEALATEALSDGSNSIPPSSRRAASTSAIDTPSSARSRSASQSRWEPGMPLPPPPPGPPPGPRSQSLSRTSEPVISPPTRRPAPSGVTSLGPVPPTPANWIDEEAQQTATERRQALTVDTSVCVNGNSTEPAEVTPESSSGGLARTRAVRGEKTLRDRRNESRTRHGQTASTSNIQPLTNILVPHSTVVAGRSSRTGTPQSGNHGRAILDSPSGGSQPVVDTSPKNETLRRPASLSVENPTPPFSPQQQQRELPSRNMGSTIAPKALPTSPPQSRSVSTSSVAGPVSRRLQTSQHLSSQASTSVTSQTARTQSARQFCQDSIERFEAFANREASATTDVERVRLFADFIVSESRIRRERYSSAIGVMGSEIFDLTRDLFQSLKAQRNSNVSLADGPTIGSPVPLARGASTTSSAETTQYSHSAPSSAGIPASPSGGSAGNMNWSSNYKPQLSPILSMSVSDAPEESSSRGRPASRWWESDSTGEASRPDRSTRESKYMGVPKEAREALQWRDPPGSADTHLSPKMYEGSTQYAQEKVAWNEDEQLSTPQPRIRHSILSLAASTPNTPSSSHMDVSRLVTLPPPYPRHHPAVNNNHPELADIRGLIRVLSDMKEVQDTKEAFESETHSLHDDVEKAASKRRQELRANLQRDIDAGKISYAQAGALEAELDESQEVQSRDQEKKNFERFQSHVVAPLNELLTSRIGQTTSLFEELRSRLFTETQASNPNTALEEGDEQPELLEKLTLLKWIFEAREALHRGVFDLLSDRNDRYKEMVLNPYKVSGNDEKLRNAESFFAEDARKRRINFASEAIQRATDFRRGVEENVERGVDMQLNAFWDIAPPLKRLLDKIPAPLEQFLVQIPQLEFSENPSYHHHPMQYLFSLLLHAEKSSYQFIEGQTNLLCLLHEVNEAMADARSLLGQAEGKAPSVVEEDCRMEKRSLTDDLKEKVRIVREQWESALGDAMIAVKERVREWLLSTGGWTDELEEYAEFGAA